VAWQEGDPVIQLALPEGAVPTSPRVAKGLPARAWQIDFHIRVPDRRYHPVLPAR
jgi:hypothetical protein